MLLPTAELIMVVAHVAELYSTGQQAIAWHLMLEATRAGLARGPTGLRARQQRKGTQNIPAVAPRPIRSPGRSRSLPLSEPRQPERHRRHEDCRQEEHALCASRAGTDGGLAGSHHTQGEIHTYSNDDFVCWLAVVLAEKSRFRRRSGACARLRRRHKPPLCWSCRCAVYFSLVVVDSAGITIVCSLRISGGVSSLRVSDAYWSRMRQPEFVIPSVHAIYDRRQSSFPGIPILQVLGGL